MANHLSLQRIMCRAVRTCAAMIRHALLSGLPPVNQRKDYAAYTRHFRNSARTISSSCDALHSKYDMTLRAE